MFEIAWITWAEKCGASFWIIIPEKKQLEPPRSLAMGECLEVVEPMGNGPSVGCQGRRSVLEAPGWKPRKLLPWEREPPLSWNNLQYKMASIIPKLIIKQSSSIIKQSSSIIKQSSSIISYSIYLPNHHQSSVIFTNFINLSFPPTKFQGSPVVAGRWKAKGFGDLREVGGLQRGWSIWLDLGIQLGKCADSTRKLWDSTRSTRNIWGFARMWGIHCERRWGFPNRLKGIGIPIQWVSSWSTINLVV